MFVGGGFQMVMVPGKRNEPEFRQPHTRFISYGGSPWSSVADAGVQGSHPIVAQACGDVFLKYP